MPTLPHLLPSPTRASRIHASIRGLIAALLFWLAPGRAADAVATESLAQKITFSTPPGLFSDTLTLSLTGASEGQKIRYTLTPPSSAGAIAPEPDATSPEYTAPLVLDAPVIVRAAVFSADGLARGPFATAQFARYTSSGAQGLGGFSSNLPLLVIDSHGLGPMVKDGIDRPGWIYGFAREANGSATPADKPVFVQPIEFAVRGTSSANFPKQSFKLKILGANGKKQAIAPFGLGKHDKWQLIGPWGFDPAFIRNAFMYELSNRIGLWAPRTRFVEVFVNRDSDGLTALDHAGIYALTDKIEPGDARVAIAGLDEDDLTPPKVTGGYIFKMDWPDPADYTWTTASGITLTLDTPDVDDVATEQAYYLETYVQQFEDALLRDVATGWQTRSHLNFINRDTWIDFHLLNTLSKNGDAFRGSAFFTKDRNGKLSAGPLWDFDRSLGSTDHRNDAWDEWRSVSDGGDGWYSDWWGYLVRDPDFMQGWIDRWQSLREDEFSNTRLAGLADDLAAQIGTAAAGRDVATFPGNESRFPEGYQGEVDHLKEWVTNRADWIDRQFTAVPTVTRKDGKVTLTAPAGTRLVYTLNGTDPRASGGAVTPSAAQTSDPLILPDNVTFAVRAFAPGKPKHPATPWSRQVAQTGITLPEPTLPRIKDSVVATGHGVIFSAGDAPGSIQWQTSSDQGATWADLSDNNTYSGTETATLTVTAPGESLNGALYRYTTDYLGTTYTSNSAALAVVPVFFPYPTGIAVDATGNLFVADAKSDTVGIITPARQVRTLTGNGPTAALNRPEGLVLLSDGLVVADTANDALRQIRSNGTLTTLAGRPGVRGHADGAAVTALFSSPKDVARDAGGALYVADAMNHVIRRIAPDGTVTTLAGAAGVSGTSDGNGAAARFNLPGALTVAPDGTLFVSDTTNHTIRRISPAGEVTTFAGLPGISGSDDGKGSAALFNRPGGLVADSAGNLYVADTGNSIIRKIAPDRTVTTLAGVPGVAGSRNGIGSDALFNQPQDLALDGTNQLYVADTGNALIRKVTPTQEVSVLALTAAPPPPPDPGPPTPPAPPDSNPDGDDSSPGGGGAPSGWFLLALGFLAWRRRR